jgi:hypothetical protein
MFAQNKISRFWIIRYLIDNFWEVLPLPLLSSSKVIEEGISEFNI